VIERVRKGGEGESGVGSEREGAEKRRVRKEGKKC